MNVGIHEIDDSYHHISFYPIQEGVLSLEGFLYPLQKDGFILRKFIRQVTRL